MVQRKVSYKLSLQPKTTLKTEDNHDVKPLTMKKSRYMKRSTDLGPEFKAPIKTPSPKKSTSCNNNSAPNFMKSTNSSELHKVRSLTKSPSLFKRKKAVLCDNVDAQRATCSSTLKEYKFPSYLQLMIGATEAKGTSVMKVCPYTYCSLNGHRHKSATAPPLKSFLASRRKLIKTQKAAVASAACKRKRTEKKRTEDAFFVEIHVPAEESTPVRIARKEGLSEWDYNNASDSSVSLDQLYGEVSDMEWEEGHTVASDEEKVDVLVQKDCGNDEIEPCFEVEKSIDEKLLTYSYDEMIMECFQFSDADTISDSESSQTDGDYFVEQIADDENNCAAKIEEESIEGRDDIIDESQNESLDSSEEHNKANGDELDKEIYLLENTRDGNICDIVMEETKLSEFLVEEESSLSGDSSQSEVDLNETNNTENESLLNSDNSHSEVDQSEANNTEDESLLKSDNSQSEVDQSEAENTEDERLNIFNESPAEYDSNEINLVEEIKESEIEDISITEKEEALPVIINKAVQVCERISDTGKDCINELEDCSTKLRKSVRRNRTEEESEDDREFNPRAPNFLPVEPEPEPEKVDLKHQDMDERKDAQDWMLDHALQKTVNQLGNARKRKVSLLVEAFEAVLPLPKYEPHIKRNLTGFASPRPVQACR